jgi:branched-chain amino acid transport system substrate-binding protein
VYTRTKYGRSSRRAGVAATAALTILVAAACGTHSDAGSTPSGTAAASNGATDCVVTFGANTELSGNLQIYGQPAADGLNAAVEDINAAGGVKVADKTCQFASEVVDNKSDPAEVFSAAQKVADADAVAALAPDINDTVAYDVWKNDGIITFSTGGQVSSGVETDPASFPLAVALIPFQVLQHEAYLRQALAFAPDIKKVSIIWPTSQGGQQIHDQTAAAVKNVGLELVSDVGFPPGTKDFSTFITKAKEGAPDLLITLYGSEEAVAIMEQAVPLKAAKYYMSETATAETILNAKGLRDATVLLPTFAPTYSAAMTIPGDQPEVIFGTGPAPFVPGASIVLYYAAWLTKQAVEKAGSTDGAAVFEALKGQSYKGPFGTCSINDQLFMQCPTAFVVVQGDKVLAQTFPDPFATTPSGTYECVDGKCTPISS